MGSVPMPTWAPKTTDQDPCTVMASATSALVVRSWASPPNSSGTSRESSPSSPASRSSARMVGKSFDSMAGEAGTIRSRPNLRAVRKNSRCSCVKASGVSMACAPTSARRKPPPIGR